MRGFTLIEILAASGILAVLAILIHGSFNISVSIWQKRQQYIEQEQDARISMDILRQKISCAYRSPWHKETGFDGSQHEIKFNAAGSDGISRVRFYLKDDCLWLEEIFGMDTIARGAASPYKLCDGVTRFDVYYGRTWSSNWSQEGPPQLVKVCLGLTHTDMPEMIVPVRAGKDYE
ncbi:MAG: prepilin-type N-terminal cleavage/methylation domain-containing protein [bacterium]